MSLGLLRRPRRADRGESQSGDRVVTTTFRGARSRAYRLQTSQVDMFTSALIVLCTVKTVLKGVAQEQTGTALPPNCWNVMTIVCGSMVFFYTFNEPLVSTVTVTNFIVILFARVGLANQEVAVGRHMLTMLLFVTSLVYVSSTVGQKKWIVYATLSVSLISICIDMVLVGYSLDFGVHIGMASFTTLLVWLRRHGEEEESEKSPLLVSHLTEVALRLIGMLKSATFGDQDARKGDSSDLLEEALKRINAPGNPVYLDLKTLSFTDTSVQEIFDQFVLRRLLMASGLSTMLLAAAMAINAAVMLWYATQSKHPAWASGMALYWALLATFVAFQRGLSHIAGMSWVSTCFGFVVPAVGLAGIMEPAFSSVMLLYVLYYDLWTSLYNVDLCSIHNGLSNTLMQLVTCCLLKLLAYASGNDFEFKITYFIVLLAVGRISMLVVLRYRLLKKFLVKMKCAVEDDSRVAPMSDVSDPMFQSGWWLDMLTIEFQDVEIEKDYRNFSVTVSESVRAFCVVAGTIRVLVEVVIIATLGSIDNVTRVVAYGVLSLLQMGCVAQRYGFLKSQYFAASIALTAVVYDSFRLVTCSDTREFGHQIYIIDGVVITAPTMMYWEWTWLAQIGVGYVLLMVKVAFSSGRATDILFVTVLGLSHTLVALAAGLAFELDRRKNFHRMYTLSDRVWSMLRFEKFGIGSEESKDRMSDMARRVSIAIETTQVYKPSKTPSSSSKSDVNVELALTKAKSSRVTSVTELFDPLTKSRHTSSQYCQEDMSDDDGDVAVKGSEGVCLFPMENEHGEVEESAHSDGDNIFIHPVMSAGGAYGTNYSEVTTNVAPTTLPLDIIDVFGCGGQTDESPSTDGAKGNSEAEPISISLPKLVPAKSQDSPFIFDLASGASLVPNPGTTLGISQMSSVPEDPAFAGASVPISQLSSMPEDPAFASVGNGALATQLDDMLGTSLLQMISPPQDPAFANTCGGHIVPLSQPSMPSLPPDALILANAKDSQFIFDIAADDSKSKDHVYPTCIGFATTEDAEVLPTTGGQSENLPPPATTMNVMTDLHEYPAYESPMHLADAARKSEQEGSEDDTDDNRNSAFIFDFSCPDRCELDTPPRILYNDNSDSTVMVAQASISPRGEKDRTTEPPADGNTNLTNGNDTDAS